MPIPIFCTNHTPILKLTLADDRAGTDFHCPKCGWVIPVPAPVPPPVPVPPRSGPVPPPLPVPVPPPIPVPPDPEPIPSVKKKAVQLYRWLLLIGSGLSVIGLAFWFLLEPVTCLFVLVGGGLIVLGALNLYSECRDECMTCGEWHAVYRTRTDVIERKKCHGLVTRRSYSTSRGAVYGGPKVGTMPSYSESEEVWNERVPIIRTSYHHTYQCRYCLAEYESDEVVEEEDFEPDEPLPPLPPAGP